LIFLSPVYAQIYKWVDEKGVTQYGPRPPQGRKAQEVQNKLASPGGGGKAPSWQDQEQEFQNRRFKQEQADAKSQTQDEKQRKACIEARDNLAQARNARRLYNLNDKGERVFQSDQERDASIARREQYIASRCH